MDYPSFLTLPPSEERSWEWIPDPVLLLFVSHLFLLSDIVNFGRVCKRWKSAMRDRLKQLNITPEMSFHRRLPMLLIPTEDKSEGEIITRNLYSLPDGKVYDLKLSVPYNNRYIGSSHGWLFFLDSLSFMVTLFNPFYFGSSKGTIQLPFFGPAEIEREKAEACGYHYFSDYSICKAILSADPSSCANDFVVMVIHGDYKRLAYWKYGDETWTSVKCILVQDIIYHQGVFLAIGVWGDIYECEITQSNSLIKRQRRQLLTVDVQGAVKRYLVASDDGQTIWQVVRLMAGFSKTRGFLVYKMQDVNDWLEWVPVRQVDNGAFFLGDSHSTHVRASDFPGILSNSIYFTSDYPDDCMNTKLYHFKWRRDSGVYLMEEGSFPDDPYVSRPLEEDQPPPIWLLPTI